MQLSLGSHSIIFDLPPENIAMLVFLWALTFLSYFYLRRFRKDRTTKLGNFETLKEVHGHKTAASPLVLGMKLVIVTLLFLAATGSVEYQTTYPVTGTDYVIAVDTSPSMLNNDYEPDRLSYTQERLSEYIDRMPGQTNISIVEFSDSATEVSTFEVDPESSIEALRNTEVDLERPGSSVAAGITTGVDAFRTSDRDKSIILATDGYTDTQETLQDAKHYAYEQEVTVNIVAIEDRTGTDNLPEELEEFNNEDSMTGDDLSDLRDISQTTGGDYYSVRNEEMLDAALRDIIIDEQRLGINSDYFILIFISLLVITEIAVYSRYGAI